MRKFSMVNTAFWNDPKVEEELTPEDKYFFLYLLTNPRTTQIGIYQITRRQMAYDLGYSMETVNALLERFIHHLDFVCYNAETRELAIRNWGRYNLQRAGKPMVDCVTAELVKVKDKTLISYIAERVENETIRGLYDVAVGEGRDTSGDLVPDVLLTRSLKRMKSRNYSTTMFQKILFNIKKLPRQ